MAGFPRRSAFVTVNDSQVLLLWSLAVTEEEPVVAASDTNASTASENFLVLILGRQLNCRLEFAQAEYSCRAAAPHN